MRAHRLLRAHLRRGSEDELLHERRGQGMIAEPRRENYDGVRSGSATSS